MYIFLGKKNNNPSNLKLPPGPTPLPIIGNLHQIGALPYRSFHNLSQKYGPVMFVKIGRVATVVISSGDASRQAMKDHDLDTCSRPSSVGPSRLSYNFLDVAFSPYSDYWREMRKLFIFELLSMKRVHMFWYAREEQINNLVEILDGASDRRETANLTKLVFGVIDGIMGTVAYGRYYVDAYFEKVLDQHLDPKREKTEHEDIVDVLIGLMKDQTASFQIIVTILYCAQNIFVGGIDTSAVTTIWAMSELIKNPRVMKKAQSEIREIVGPNQKRVEGRDLDKFKYLELIMRETFRKQPPVPLLIPHYCVKHCKIGGYDILPGTQVLVNTYSLGRDPKCWVDPETFYPERFEGSDVDYRGSHFELVPFGAGRRICPGLAMGTTAVKYTLSNLLYHYDFELPGGMKLEDFPLEAVGGITVHNKHDLIVIPKKHDF
ncbi:2-methylbutanal oxime monooxygenase [Linum perenne]